MTNKENLQQELDETYEVVKERDKEIEELKEVINNLQTAIDQIYDIAKQF